MLLFGAFITSIDSSLTTFTLLPSSAPGQFTVTWVSREQLCTLSQTQADPPPQPGKPSKAQIRTSRFPLGC